MGIPTDFVLAISGRFRDARSTASNPARRDRRSPPPSRSVRPRGGERPRDERDPADVVMESANKALVRAFSNSEDLARYFIDAFNWLVGRVSKALINTLMGLDGPMAA